MYNKEIKIFKNEKNIIFLLSAIIFKFCPKATIIFLRDFPYDKYELNTSEDSLTFYLSVTPSKDKLPLIVYIQGSGTNSLFTERDGKIRPESGHISWCRIAKEKCRVLIVEKPGIKYLQAGQSKSFDKKFSLESWSNRIVNTINYVTQNEKINTDKILIVGHSEGGIVASRVAGLLNDKASNVAIMAGEGPSQLYSLYKFADDGTFFNTQEHNMPISKERIDYLEHKWQEILKDPNNTNKKFWGFTYLRWSSMLKTSVIDELSNFNGKILFIQGTADKNVYPESATVAYTSLLSKGRKVELEIVENADHSFNIKDNPNVDGWKMTIQKIIDWFNQ